MVYTATCLTERRVGNKEDGVQHFPTAAPHLQFLFGVAALFSDIQLDGIDEFLSAAA